MSLYARQIAGTVVLFVIARYLSVYEYGLFSSYKTIAMFVLLFANMGYESYILVSSKKNVKIIKIKIFMFLLNALAVLMFSIFISPFMKFENLLIFILVLCRQFFDGTFFALVLPYFQSANKFVSISIINIIYSLLIVIIATISYYFKLSLTCFLYLSVILGLINFIQCIIYIRIPIIKYIKEFFALFSYIDKSIMGYMLVNICFILYTQIPSFYIANFVSRESAALFFAAFTISSVVNLFIGAKCQKIMPEFITRNVNTVKLILKNSVFSTLIITFFIFIFFVFFGKFILKLLYSKPYYVNAYLLLLILSLGNILWGVGKVFSTYIISQNYYKVIWKMQIESILVSIIILILLNNLGVYAAAISYFCSLVYISTKYIVFSLKILKEGENI